MTARDEILRAANALFNPGDVVELRIFEAKRGRNTIIAGYFDNFEKLAQAAPSYSGRPGIEGLYWTLNPCVPALLARAANRLKHLKFTTSDRDIRKRAMLLVDSDPVRPSGISATDDEKKRAADVARQIRRHLRQECWPEPFVADSGNGYHLLYSVDLPNFHSKQLNSGLLRDQDWFVGRRDFRYRPRFQAVLCRILQGSCQGWRRQRGVQAECRSERDPDAAWAATRCE